MINKYLSDVNKIIEQRLISYFKNKKNTHPLLKKSMLYSLCAGGKRIRPTLVFLFYELSGKHKKDIIDAACAVEMIHTYSLIHDDLPPMDDDDLRRGKPTNHIVFGEATAILAGDGLLTDAFHMISNIKKIEDKYKIKAIEILADKAGSNGMVSGQIADMLFENTKEKNKTKLTKIISYIHTHKTADMLCASCQIGRILSGIINDTDKIEKFGKNIGLAFQIKDDILDVTQTPEKLGKNPSDVKNKKLTYVSLFGIDKSIKLAEKSINNALNILKNIQGNLKTKKIIEELCHLILRREQ
ncbi:MAG: polyprenyl synthetase family protein [Elusimicrobiales bacterium]|nr:polyprenyl synthetase family protein [Elusimicrobiales bacterium]